MTRKSKRELERAVETLSIGDDPDGFHLVVIGGDPDAAGGGYYSWNADRGVYENTAGHELPPEERPTGEPEVNINGGTAP